MKIKTKYLLLGLAAVLFLRRKKGVVGKVAPRHWLYEIGVAQNAGIDLTAGYNSQYETKLTVLARNNGVKLTAKDIAQGVSLAEKYYKQLARKFKPIAAEVGKIEYPFEQTYILNSNGDKVITVNDYDELRDRQRALEYVETELAGADDNTAAYFATIAAIARGAKFIWKDKKKHGVVTAKGLCSSLFGNDEEHEGERRAYIKILGKESKGAVYPEKFAEELSLTTDVRNGVLEALRSCRTPSAASDICLEAYYKTFERPDDPDEDLPF